MEKYFDLGRAYYTYLKSSTKKDRKRQIICWIENHLKKIDNYIEN